MWLTENPKRCSLERSPLNEQETSVMATAELVPSLLGIIPPGAVDVT